MFYARKKLATLLEAQGVDACGGLERG